MSQVQYQIFCKYLNERNNKVVSNTSKKEWISIEEWSEVKIAYNVTDPEQSNAFKTVVNSINTEIPAGSTYRALFNAISDKMKNKENPLRYNDLSVEEQMVYNKCNRFLDIVNKVSRNECVIESMNICPLLLARYNEVKPKEKCSLNGWKTKIRFYKENGKDKETSKSTYFGWEEKNGKWESQEEYNEKYAKHEEEINKKNKELATVAIARVGSEILKESKELLFEEIKYDNEKNNMLFTYDGIGTTQEQFDYYKSGNTFKKSKFIDKIGAVKKPYFGDGQLPGIDNKSIVAPTFLFERMKRLENTPWFLITTCNSLQTAISKVNQLVSIYGKDAVKIGKVVPLEQYIEIV